MDESRFVPASASSEPPDVSDLRCRDCQQLRRSLPRHTSGCRYAHENCPGCAYAEQDHIASCPIASQLKLPTDDCCEGVDLPSVGHVHSPDCGNKRPVLRASHTLPTAAPRIKIKPEEDGSDYHTGTSGSQPDSPPSEPSMLEEFPDLFAELLFAARDLAQSRVAVPEHEVLGLCLECSPHATALPLQHSPLCKAARVLGVLDRLCALAPTLAASLLSTFVADGRPESEPEKVFTMPAAILRQCPKCGAMNANWHAEQRPGDEVWLDCLGLNQCVGAGKNGQGHTLYTHRCGQIGGAPHTGDYGEPLRAANTQSGAMLILDAEGTVMLRTVSSSPQESRDWADRVVACVNFCAGDSTEDLNQRAAVRSAKKGGAQ